MRGDVTNRIILLDDGFSVKEYHPSPVLRGIMATDQYVSLAIIRCTIIHGTRWFIGASVYMWRLIFLSLLALANISPTFVSLWGYEEEEFRRLTTSEVNINEIQFAPGSQHTGNRGEVLCVYAEEESVRVEVCTEGSGVLPWYSPADWQVREVLFSDLNLDGEEEISLLVWRPFQPWPVDRFMPSGGRIASHHDEDGMSCHLILIGLVNGEIRELWAGSALADPIEELRAADLDGDGLQELYALEYAYNGDPGRASLTVWSWRGFGFSLQSRQEGHFSSLLVLPAQSGNVLLAH